MRNQMMRTQTIIKKGQIIIIHKKNRLKGGD